MFDKINPKQNLPELEEQILEFWKKHSIFKKQVEQRPHDNKYVFYDGPPFITGLPHYGHLLGSISKDIIPRFHAMKGKRVERRWGWDCHGLPIESKVEKELGIKNKKEAEAYGIDKLIEHCYKYTRDVSAQWNWYIDKIGRWVDMDNDYRTMDQDYMETVMWVFKQMYDRKHIYEGVRTSLFDPMSGTPISNFEVAMDNSYADIEDPAITVKFKILNFTNSKFQIPNSKQKIFLISGKHAFASTEYYPRLKKQFEESGYKVEIIDHVDPDYPLLEENLKNFENYDFKNSIVVTHSLGGSTILEYVTRNNISLERLIMLAPPTDFKMSRDQEWVEKSGYKKAALDLDYKKAIDLIKNIDLVYTDNDKISEEDFENLGDQLGANLHMESGKEHFFGKDSTHEPESVEQILTTYNLQPTPNSKSDIFNSEISILAWTTTPWTMPSNRALVVDKDGEYVLVKVQKLNVELEKAWLIKELPDLKKAKKSQVTQAYLNDHKDEKGREVKDARIRKQDGVHTLTVKFFAGDKKETGQLIEETKEITKEEYIELIKTAKNKVVKTRYYFDLEDGLTAELDIYENNLKGLEVVEVEFPSLAKEKAFKTPEWFGKEVTDSKGIYPAHIADMNIEDVKKMNDEYEQAEHNFEAAAVEEYIILGKNRIKETLGKNDYEIVSEFKGETLLGLEYEPPFNFIPGNENDFKVYHFEGMVSAEEGVGIVHSAPGFGEIDTKMGEHYGLSMMFENINDEGKFIDAIIDYAGMFYADANPIIIEDMKKKNILFKLEKITHRMPISPRWQTPLIYRSQNSWFIDVQKLKPDLVANNEKINWVPSNIKEGRFKKGLENAPDWGISRSRYWGTPMPVWQSTNATGEIEERLVIGSRDELMERNDEITKIILVRHAAADKHKSHIEGINEKGKEQVKALVSNFKNGEGKLKSVAILSSSLPRACETAEPLAHKLGLELKIDERFGSIGQKEELYRKKKEMNVPKLRDSDEETVLKVNAEQLEKDKKTIEDLYKEYKGQTIIIVTHQENIARMRHILEGGNLLGYYKRQLANTGQLNMYLFKGKLLDLHRPVIDDIILKGDKVSELKRVPETLDVWMESASMPYAQMHYPFENKEEFEANFPADYISEYIAQTRAWFYVMHVVSTALFNKNSFKNCVTTGVIFGNDGRKMSKSFGNYPDPKGVINNYGGDALRMYLLSLPLLRGENANIDENAIKGQLRDFLLPLWNIYAFLLTYAEINNWKPEEKLVNNIRSVKTESHKDVDWDHIPFADPKHEMDKWIVAKLQMFIREVTLKLDNYDIPGATALLPEFLGELSKWYIRRSRDRFKKGDIDAMQTLYYVLVEFIKTIAPFTPFIAESIYQNLVKNWIGLEDQPESVHLNDYPHADVKFLEKYSLNLKQMESVMAISSMGQTLRVENHAKVRQPLAKIEVSIDREAGKEKQLEDWMKEIIKEELNIKEVVEIGLKEEHQTGEGFISAEDSKTRVKITLDLNLTTELKEEGLYREFVRGVQALRKKLGLKYGEQTNVAVYSESVEINEMLKAMSEKIKTDINASDLTIKEGMSSEALAKEGEKIVVNQNEVYVKIG